jgi:hypothetical protein
VEGVLRVGSGPGVQKTLALSFERPYDRGGVPRAYFDYDATTDAQGRFTFERALPGKAKVYRTIRYAVRDNGGYSSMYSHGARVDLEPGKTTKVEMGGIGRPVEGRLVLPEGDDEPVDFNFASGRLTTKLTTNILQLLPGVPTSRQESETYAFSIQPDGRFRCDDVPAGSYECSIRVHEPPLPNQ